MTHFSIVVSVRSGHQNPAALALKAGLEKHGHTAEIGYEASDDPKDIVVCWGWRSGQRHHERGREVLVMERSYLRDRFLWFSFGWNGLNGNAGFYVAEKTDPTRWNHFFRSALKPENTGGEYALICGQVQGDASLRDCPSVDGWYRTQAEKLQAAGIPVFFRDHPLGRHKWVPEVKRLEGTLDEAFSGAKVVIAWNSNSLVDAVLAGVPIYSGSPGCMAHALSQPSPVFTSAKKFDRDRWGCDMSYLQWKLDEVESGHVIPLILQGQFEDSFSSTVRGKYDL